MVEVTYHPLIEKDIQTTLDYYQKQGGKLLSDRFFKELEATITKITENPRRFHFLTPELRRASLRAFPFHILYKEDSFNVHILILRHDKRHPKHGLGRK